MDSHSENRIIVNFPFTTRRYSKGGLCCPSVRLSGAVYTMQLSARYCADFAPTVLLRRVNGLSQFCRFTLFIIAPAECLTACSLTVFANRQQGSIAWWRHFAYVTAVAGDVTGTCADVTGRCAGGRRRCIAVLGRRRRRSHVRLLLLRQSVLKDIVPQQTPTGPHTHQPQYRLC